jgi:MFS family permease
MMQSLLENKGIEAAFELVGGNNYYQKRSLLVLITHHIFRSFFVMYYPFMNQPPVFQCRDPNDPTVFYDCTENTGGCAERIFSPNSPSSLVVDLGLYCEKSYVRTLAGFMFFLSQNIGSGYFAYLSDKSGRRKSLMYSYLLGGVSLVCLGMGSIGPVTYIIFLMLVRGMSSSYSSISLTYLAEVGNQQFAKTATLVVLLTQTSAGISVVVLAFFVTSWKVMIICCIAIPTIVVCLTFRLLFETPVFYLVKKDFKNTMSVLHNIAQVNQMPVKLQDFVPSISEIKNNVKDKIREKSVRTWNYIQIMMDFELRKRVLPYSIVKLYLYMAYYGSLFAVSGLGGNIYMNLLIAGVAEGIGYLMSIKAPGYSYDKLLRVSLQMTTATGIGFLLIPSISSTGSNFIPLLFQGFLALVLRASISFIYGFIYSLGNELFPGEVRSQSIGISDIFSAMGGMTCPFIIMFAEKNGLNPLFLFGIAGLIPLYASQSLPDPKIPIPGFQEQNEDIEMRYVKMPDQEQTD